ncbi:MAG: hypothetical protein CGU28_13550 [Candidatus Dactylopiibacterium carminicum]|uniref:YggT family protein n=1 Tax=Candidatus Dactylopiibacterium carminicum TaxID=857335 RepID=A0A272ERF1_9RHOO|nr:YggT family protein [Candidatus Dactylopiibacterium carminicum]KAF7598790.1 hypothetical protein BGI27_11360 [Candidatus Dactylopiibacterium carminicum]PAS92683.1 MAG: hypothetical protein CGU29_10615 [Candidatus Dactylopiibacterium carminicum]PAS94726.1 MAG: hypothetical protein CGU28_13550 [Candidatus Dactylopiibacterium carminicum]PAS98811.1 MAG: hypothetical protein BSR46_11375 [Candidatus Dactylopiibacterium carminicum]
MAFDILTMILRATAGFFTLMFLVRTAMRFLRVSFITPLGQFVLATTNWATVPLQRVLPAIGRLDPAALLPAWLMQALLVLLLVFLSGRTPGAPLSLLLGCALIGALELLYLALYLVMGVVIIGVVLSWVNPYAPLAGPINALSRPLLAPFRRILPPISGIDISPLIFLLVVQILLYVLQRAAGSFYFMLYI